MKVKSLVHVAVMAALITLCAWITIPTVVPFTLQTFAIFLAVGILGGKLGSLSVLVYLLLGAVGLPVFSGFSGGIGRFAGVTGGYLIGFLLIPLVMWGAQTLFGKGPVVFVLSAVVGLAVCYAFGTAWFCFVMDSTPMAALSLCVIPFIPGDLVKMLLAMWVGPMIRRRLVQAGLYPERM